MHSSVTQVLLKIFSKPFYRAHSGVFLMMLLILVAPGGDVLKFHKAMMLYLVVEPLALTIAFGIATLYFLRCLQFTYATIDLEQNKFLFYSLNSFARLQHLLGWSTVIVSVSMPILLYFGVCILLSIGHGHWLSAFVILSYLIIMILATACLCVWKMKRLIRPASHSLLSKLTKQWKKPFHLLFLYQIFKAHKAKYLLIKLISYASIMAVFRLFDGVTNDIRIASIGIIAVSVAHSLLIFEEHQFRDRYLRFGRTLAYSRVSIFCKQILMISILLLPEAVWLLFKLPVTTASLLFAFSLSICSLLSNTLTALALNQEVFLKIVFATFVLLFVAVLYKLLVALIMINLLMSYLLFFFNYYKFRVGPETP